MLSPDRDEWNEPVLEPMRKALNLRGIWMKTCNPEETGTQQLIFPPNSRPSNFEEGIELGRDQERQRLAAYFHDQLAPDLMALAFSIEAIRIELESEKHPAEAKLKDIRDRVSKCFNRYARTY
jgi:signal transduction histidine kinase